VSKPAQQKQKPRENERFIFFSGQALPILRNATEQQKGKKSSLCQVIVPHLQNGWSWWDTHE